MKCPNCGNDDQHIRTGKYFGKNCTKQRFQCRACRGFFRIDIPHKGNEHTTNGLSGATQEE